MATGNYAASKSFLDDFVNNRSLQCHDTSGQNCSVVEKMCKAMNNCNSGKCLDNGMCECPRNFKGADCSYPVNSESTKVKTEGTKWIYYSYDFSDPWKLSITSDSRPISIYIGLGIDSNPNAFNHDINFKKV